MKNLVLASGSPQRAQLIQKLTPQYEIYPSKAAEIKTLIAALTPQAAAMLNAKTKANAVFADFAAMGKKVTVLGADTVVVSPEGKLLNKPHDIKEAAEHILCLSGKTHSVYTGFFVVDAVKNVMDFDETQVTLKTLSKKEVEEYVKDGHTLDKSGGYSIAELMQNGWVEKIDGSIDNVIGLPTEKLKKVLDRF